MNNELMNLLDYAGLTFKDSKIKKKCIIMYNFVKPPSALHRDS